jgi:hypothetical protein
MRRTLVSFAASAALIAAGLLAASPAEAAFRVIKWDVTKIARFGTLAWAVHCRTTIA